MPRKKTVPPPLDAEFTLPSDDKVEIGSVEAHAYRTATRGRAKVIECWLKNDAILKYVFGDYFIIEDKRGGVLVSSKYSPPKDDYLRNASAFARHIEQSLIANPSGPDSSSLRKKHYPEIKRHIEAMRNALLS